MKFSSFKDYLVEEEKTVYFTFGRMNPPTIGHGLLLKVLADKARQNPYRVYVSQSSDAKRNPLSYGDKVKYIRKMFPKQSRSVIKNIGIKNVFDAATSMHDEGFKNAIMVIGSDRIKEFDVLLQKYNGVKGKHGFYNFKTLSVISAGERDPDGDGVQGASASKQRNAAKENDFIAFTQGLPKTMSDKDAKGLFNAVRSGMGLKEESEFKNHIQLKSVSDIREKFVTGNIFNVDDFVMIRDVQEKALITHRGSNYLILEKEDGSTTRKWIDSIDPIEETYEMGTTEYLKHAKKITPGETVNDDIDHTSSASDKIKREKETDAKRHDRMLDRARLLDTKKKNKSENRDFSSFRSQILKNKGK